MKKDALLSAIIVFVYTIFFISIFFSFRAISSISIGVLLIAGITKHDGQIKNIIRHNKARLFLIACITFFLLQFIPLLYTSNSNEEWKNILLKSGMVLIPLAVMLSGPFEEHSQKKLLVAYCLSLLAAGLYCLFKSFLFYRSTGNVPVFYYHELVKPLQQHAVYFSIYIFISLVLLLENIQRKIWGVNNIVSLSLITFFSILLFLLSSKLIITFYILYLLYYLIVLTRKTVLNRKVTTGVIAAIVIVISTIFFTNNPISDRFRDITAGKLAVIKQDKYTPGDYFNGIQFRLLQWKLVSEILNTHNSWWQGVSAANAQPFLDEEYIAKDMYLGDPSTGNRGYREYNTHNQFLESLLNNGIPGLLAMLFIYFTLIKIILQKKQSISTFIIALLLIYAAIESVFETQYGIILFTFFPVFLCVENKNEPTINQPISILKQ